jgi:hypothetical protein
MDRSGGLSEIILAAHFDRRTLPLYVEHSQTEVSTNDSDTKVVEFEQPGEKIENLRKLS